MKLVIAGRPITKKNHEQIALNPRTGRRRLVPSKRYQAYEEEAVAEIWQQAPRWRHPTIAGHVHVCAVYWMPNRQSWPDLLGLEETTADVLQAAGLLENDRQIVSWDGSHIAGVDRENPRAEIDVREQQPMRGSDEIMALEGRALDAAVAEQVIGLAVDWPDGEEPWVYDPRAAPRLSRGVLPSYSSDVDAARKVEDRIDELGLRDRYIRALWDGADFGDHPGYAESTWRMIHATAEQRCRAALMAITPQE